MNSLIFNWFPNLNISDTNSYGTNLLLVIIMLFHCSFLLIKHNYYILFFTFHLKIIHEFQIPLFIVYNYIFDIKSNYSSMTIFVNNPDFLITVRLTLRKKWFALFWIVKLWKINILLNTLIGEDTEDTSGSGDTGKEGGM